MDIAALICNDLNYESVLQAYSIFKHCNKEDNQVQLINLNLNNNKGFFEDRKNKVFEDFLEENTILTSIKYTSYSEVEENPPLADRYIVSGAKSSEIVDMNNNTLLYGIKEMEKETVEKLAERYYGVSTLFESKVEDVAKVADPILLLTKDNWLDFADRSTRKSMYKDYAVLYTQVATKDMLAYAKNLSDARKEKVFIIADKIETPFYRGKRLKGLAPQDLVKVLSQAKDIITSNDLGIEYGVIFDKELHIFRDISNDYQIENINELKLLDRIVDSPDRVITKSSDYSKALEVIGKLRENSLEFISK